jgi:hypothetical protein
VNIPTKEQKFDFLNDGLKELKVGKKQNIIIDGRVYEVKYKGLDKDVFIPLKDVSN